MPDPPAHIKASLYHPVKKGEAAGERKYTTLGCISLSPYSPTITLGRMLSGCSLCCSIRGRFCTLTLLISSARCTGEALHGHTCRMLHVSW